jgi:hypothetical protein
MKKLTLAVNVLIITAILLYAIGSCSKSSNPGSNNNLSTTPAAQATYDNQSGGVYKGTLTGSSGYFEINLQASKPFIIFQWTNPQGSIDSLFTTALSGWQSGQAIDSALFEGADGSRFWFSVDANGENPSIDSIHIPSHAGPVYAMVAKELSTNQVKIYQGTAKGASSNGGDCSDASLTFWISSSEAGGAYLASNSDYGSLLSTVSGNHIYVLADGNNAETGTLTISSNGNTITGTVSGSSCSHTISLTRIF